MKLTNLIQLFIKEIFALFDLKLMKMKITI